MTKWLAYLMEHLALEGVGVDEAGHLVRIACPNPDTLHRVYVVRHADGARVFFQAGLPEELRHALLGLPVRDFFEFPERVTAILETDQPCAEIHIGKSYVFPPEVSAHDYPDVVRASQLDAALLRGFDPELEGAPCEIYCVLAGGRVVAACLSSRENEQAGEAWVRTLKDYRRRGYARQATAAWAHALLQAGKRPFYSHRSDNLASAAVARSLGLVPYIEDAGYA